MEGFLPRILAHLRFCIHVYGHKSNLVNPELVFPTLRLSTVDFRNTFRVEPRIHLVDSEAVTFPSN